MSCKIYSFYSLLILLQSGIFIFPTNAQLPKLTDSAIISNIHLFKTNKLRILHSSSKLNELITKQQITPLFAAIQYDKPKMVKYLLSIGANPNKKVKKTTPLLYALERKNPTIIKHLLKAGAFANCPDTNGNTPLMIAAQKMPLHTIKQLIKHSAQLNAYNPYGLKAIYFAQTNDNKHVINYLHNLFENELPNYSDGPYIFYKSHRQIKTSFLKYDSLSKKYCNKQNTHSLKESNTITIGNSKYRIQEKFRQPPTFYSDIKKIFVFGDIHGQCDSLIKFLRSEQIIDSQHNWIFGNGHLVFLGDLFDRGNQVTETLWLLYKLETEAQLQGGNIHLILGNHELMILNGDDKYQNEKYFYLFKHNSLDYLKLFNNQTVLGRWLRSKNSMEIINNILFVHGGINEDILKYKLSADTINYLINNYLNKKIINPLTEYLLGANGIFWYRGLVPTNGCNYNTENQIININHYFKVTKIIVGHTLVPHITSFYNGKIIAVDIPYYQLPKKQFEALLIDSTGFYRITTSHGKEKL